MHGDRDEGRLQIRSRVHDELLQVERQVRQRRQLDRGFLQKRLAIFEAGRSIDKQKAKRGGSQVGLTPGVKTKNPAADSTTSSAGLKRDAKATGLKRDANATVRLSFRKKVKKKSGTP